MVEEIIKEVKSKQQEIANLKKELHKKSEEAFFAGAKEILKTFPDLKSVSWSQYTPYFNDGDTCEFSANTDSFEINEDSVNTNNDIRPTLVVTQGVWNREKRQYDGRVEKPNPSFNKNLADGVDAMSEFLGVFDEDFYKQQFGDHVKVTITSEGVETTDYDHD
jgi:uncharacterized small protein (DUF1192 family)